MLRDLGTIENVRIFPFFAKNGGKLFSYSEEDIAIALVSVMYDGS